MFKRGVLDEAEGVGGGETNLRIKLKRNASYLENFFSLSQNLEIKSHRDCFVLLF
jgi:hypothetical protein